MVHQRLSHFERVSHAGAVDLGVDVAYQVGLEIEVLDQRERVFGVGAPRMPMKYLYCVVAADLRFESGGEQLASHVLAEDRHTVEIGFHRISSQRLESRLGAQIARSP